MPKVKKRSIGKHVDTPRTKLSNDLAEKLIMRTPLRNVTNGGILSRANSIAQSEISLSPVLESPEADRRHPIVALDKSPGFDDFLLTPKRGDTSHDLSDLGPLNFSTQTDDSDFDPEINKLNQSFVPIPQSPNQSPLPVEFKALEVEQPKLGSRKRKRAAISPQHHALLEEKKVRQEDPIKHARHRLQSLQAPKPMPTFQSPVKPSRERCASSLMIPAKSDLFQRCQSVMPMENLTYQSEQSDWSKKELTPTEVAEAVLANQIEFDSQKFDKMVIIDARYDYEYSGGHIKGSINIPKIDENVWQASIKEMFFGEESRKSGSTTAVIFHCEYSVDRGPNMRDWFREHDRSVNQYPKLSYPKIFVLKGGFRQFHKEIEDSAVFEPSRSYVEEKDERHKEKNDKISRQKTKAKRRNKRKRPVAELLSRSQRRPGLRELAEDNSTPVARRRRKIT